MQKEEHARASVSTVAAISGTVFLIEVVIMAGLALLGVAPSSFPVFFFDAGLLAIITAPLIYYLVRIPVRREFERRRQAERRADTMSRLAVIDPLTETLNRRGITAALLESMAFSERYNHPLTIALVDIDHFKQVNDRFGHEAGDRVLVGLATIFFDTVRQSDRVGRYGGEEFLLVFPETILEASRQITDRIRVRVSEWSLDTGTNKIKVTVSIGVTQFETGEEHNLLFSRADKAMYEAKQSGRNLVVVR